MDKVYLSHNNIVSGYGFDSTSAIDQIEDEISSLSLIEDTSILPQPFYSSRIQQNSLEAKYAQLNSQEKHTRLEQLFLVSLSNTISKSNIKLTDRVGLLISTTKGNINVLEESNPFPDERAYLNVLGEKIKNFFDWRVSWYAKI